VSICLPVYNGERFLAEAIESARAQTFSDFELLIADDQSQDSSLDIARSYAEKDSRIVVWSNPVNLGLFANYNAAMRRASGKYVKLFAQDDLLAPKMLERALEAFASSPAVNLVGTARLEINERGESEKVTKQLDSSRLIAGRDVIDGCLVKLYNWIGEPSAVMFPSDAIGNGFDESFHHLGDLEYWLRILERGDYAFINEPLCQFRHHRGSATNKNMRTLLCTLDMFRLGRIYRDRLSGLGIDEQEFVRRTVEFSAHYVHTLVREEGVVGREIASIAVARNDSDELLTDYRELAFQALYQLEAAQMQAAAWQAECDRERFANEELLRDIQRSRSWRLLQAVKSPRLAALARTAISSLGSVGKR
jgi:glycosyltransferase involved in cell wall biosynthesis